MEPSVWTYTHSWRRIKRSSWGRISVLASCETIPQARQAMQRGYAAAIVKPSAPNSQRAYRRGGIRFVPCPEQTGATANCYTCKLCWKDQQLLKTKTVIVFLPHGSRRKRVAKTLIRLQKEAT